MDFFSAGIFTPSSDLTDLWIIVFHLFLFLRQIQTNYQDIYKRAFVYVSLQITM